MAPPVLCLWTFAYEEVVVYYQQGECAVTLCTLGALTGLGALPPEIRPLGIAADCSCVKIHLGSL